MLALATTVFIASLTGSGHCLGMCGPFVGLVSVGRGPHSRWRRQGSYHGGRLAAYLAIGAVAGSAGKLLDVGGTRLGIQQTATKLAGIVMVAVGLTWLIRRWLPPRRSVARRWSGRDLVGRFLSRSAGESAWRRSFGLGLATTFMPCGWLYVFAINAAGTGSPLHGALLMTAFWLGTLPALVVLGAGLGRLSPALERFVPQFMAVLIIAVGIFTIVQRAPLDVVAGARLQHAESSPSVPCHGP